MNRRSFLSSLLALPLVNKLKPSLPQWMIHRDAFTLPPVALPFPNYGPWPEFDECTSFNPTREHARAFAEEMDARIMRDFQLAFPEGTVPYTEYTDELGRPCTPKNPSCPQPSL